MGYSISIHCKTTKESNKMQDFLDKNFTLFHNLIKNHKTLSLLKILHTANSKPCQDLPYDSNQMAVGFTGHSIDSELYYRFSILAWMAIKVGKPSIYKGIKLATVYWDGSNRLPIHRKKSDFNYTPDNGRKVVYDSKGWHKFDSALATQDSVNILLKPLFILQIKQQEILSKVVKEEIERLDNLWKLF